MIIILIVVGVVVVIGAGKFILKLSGSNLQVHPKETSLERILENLMIVLIKLLVMINILNK